MTSLKELLVQREALEKKIEALKASEMAEAISKVRALIDEYSLTADQVFPPESSSKTRKTRKTLSAKVAAKYRDPNSGKEWSGRGMTPKWLLGKDKNEFLIV